MVSAPAAFIFVNRHTFLQSRLNGFRNRGKNRSAVTQPDNTRCSRTCRRRHSDSSDVIGRQRHQFAQVSGNGSSRTKRSSYRTCDRSAPIIHRNTIRVLSIRVVRDSDPNLGPFPRIRQDLNLTGWRRRKHCCFGEFGSIRRIIRIQELSLNICRALERGITRFEALGRGGRGDHESVRLKLIRRLSKSGNCQTAQLECAYVRTAGAGIRNHECASEIGSVAHSAISEGGENVIGACRQGRIWVSRRRCRSWIRWRRSR